MKKPSFFNRWPFTKSKGESPRRIIEAEPEVHLLAPDGKTWGPDNAASREAKRTFEARPVNLGSDPLSELAQHLPKTREEWVQTLPEPIRSHAYRNAEKHHWSPEFWREPLNSMLSALGGCFHWDSSPEGSEYWFQVERGNYTKAADILRAANIKPETSHDIDYKSMLDCCVGKQNKVSLCLDFYDRLTYIQIAAKTGLEKKDVSRILANLRSEKKADRKLKAILSDGKWYASWSKV